MQLVVLYRSRIGARIVGKPWCTVDPCDKQLPSEYSVAVQFDIPLLSVWLPMSESCPGVGHNRVVIEAVFPQSHAYARQAISTAGARIAVYRLPQRAHLTGLCEIMARQKAMPTE